MAYPVPVVEIAFSDGPYVVSPTWTDVTAYVTDLSTSRGRDDDWGRFTGTAQVTLLNNDRRFDPFYTSGPYYGNLKPRRQIRIRSTWNGNTYDVFRGFIQGWPPAWTDAGKMSTVTLSCFDALDLLGSNTMPVEWARSYILSTGPRHYYPCDEPITTFSAGGTIRDLGSSPLPLTITANASNGMRMAAGLPSSSLQGIDGYAASGSTALNSSTNFSVAAWAISDTYNNPVCHGNHGLYDWYLARSITEGKYLVIIRDGATGSDRQWTTTSLFDTSQPHHLVFSFNISTKALVFYVDGIQVSMSNSTTGAIVVNLNEQFDIGYGQAQQVCLWTDIVTQAGIREIYNRSLALFAETTSARITRIIGETPFSASLVSTPASPASSVINIGIDAPTATSELERTATSEYGPLFVSRSGVLTMFQQEQIRTQSSSVVSQATFGAGGQSIGQTIELQYDGDALRNVANVEASEGAVVTVRNESSITAFGQAEEYAQTYLSNLPDTTDVATIVSSWGGQVYADAGEVEVCLSPSATWSSVLNLELCDRFTLAVQPSSGNAITVPMLLNRVRHEAQPGRWRSFVTGSARWAAVFILDQSVLDGTDLLG